jgi:hypothetical protein
LPINLEKSGIRKPVQFEILGYRYVPTYEKGTKSKYQLVVSDKSWKKLKLEAKTITRKTAPLTFRERATKLKTLQQVKVLHLASMEKERQTKKESD